MIGYNSFKNDTNQKYAVFWNIQEILNLMDTEIFQFGQRGAEKNKFKDFFNLISKSSTFGWITAFLIFWGE